MGLDTERLARDIEELSVDTPIERNALLANVLGVRGTAAFVIGDDMIRGALLPERFRAGSRGTSSEATTVPARR